MPITEIATPSLKQDEATRSTFEGTIQPILSKTLNLAQGIKWQFIAPMLTENGENVQSAVKYALVLGQLPLRPYAMLTFTDIAETEWETAQHFHDFLATPQFQAFGAQVKPFATAPPQPQIFETDLSPSTVFSSPLTEVFRIGIGSGGNNLDVVREAWKAFIAATEISLPGLPSLSGTSLNLDQELFLGVVGWAGVDVSP